MLEDAVRRLSVYNESQLNVGRYEAKIAMQQDFFTKAEPEKLKKILTYHVVEGLVTSDQVVDLESAETLNGKPIKIAADDGQVMINDANVIAADIMCKNGVIHVLDMAVLRLPVA